MHVQVVECEYMGEHGVAAAYIVSDGDEVAIVETNTTHAVPKILDALATSGFHRSQVRYVVCTHIHLDHAGGAGHLMAECPNARLLLHPRAAPHAIDPSRIIAGATAVYGEERFEALYGTIVPVEASRVDAMDNGSSAPFGNASLGFLHTRGHANHHFCVSAGDGMFTGDSFGIAYPALQSAGLFAFPSTTPTDFDPEAAHASIDAIASSGVERVWLTHFGEHRALAAMASQLHQQLDDYAEILRTADASGREGADLEAYCAERVRALFDAELAKRGLTESAARKLLGIDIDLNGQGVAFAVTKLRYKRAQAG